MVIHNDDQTDHESPNVKKDAGGMIKKPCAWPFLLLLLLSLV